MECECEERRIMLIRSWESHPCVADLDAVQRRTCLVSGTLSFPLIQSLRTIHPSAQLQKCCCCEITRFPATVVHGTLHVLSMKLRDWNSGSHSVMNEMLSRDVFLDQTAPSHCSMRIRTLSPDPWLLSPFSPPPLDTSRTSLFTPSLSLMGQLTY